MKYRMVRGLKEVVWVWVEIYVTTETDPVVKEGVGITDRSSMCRHEK